MMLQDWGKDLETRLFIKKESLSKWSPWDNFTKEKRLKKNDLMSLNF